MASRRSAKPRKSAKGKTKRKVRTATPEQAAVIAGKLGEVWPNAVVELDYRDPYELLVATILSAQSTDKMINAITPALFAKYPNATALAAAEPAEVEPLIFKSGFYRNKAKHIVGMARAVVAKHGGEIPRTMDELVALPGVARKTANVVLGSAMGVAEGMVVDTHVTRLAQRLHLTAHTDPVKIEDDLMKLLPREQWIAFPHRLIWHGRRVCFAKDPACDHCQLAPMCPSAALFTIKKKPAKKPAKARARA
jgi:endonuclease-3